MKIRRNLVTQHFAILQEPKNGITYHYDGKRTSSIKLVKTIKMNK